MINLLLFSSIYISGIVMALLSAPVYAFVLYQIVYFMNPQNRWWSGSLPDYSYSFLAVILMLLVYALNFKTLNKNSLLKAPPFKWVYCLLIGYFIVGYYASYPGAQEKGWDAFWKLVLIISIAYKLIPTAKTLGYSIYGYIFGSWYIGFIAYQTGRNSGDRVEGIGTVDANAANTLAAAIAPSLVFCIYYFWVAKNHIVRGLIAIAGVFIANSIILINSRGSMLGIFCGASFFLWYMYTSTLQKENQKKAVLGLCFLGLLSAAYLADDNFVDRMYSMKNVEINEEKESGSTRFIFWLSSIKFAKDYPFGSGARGFEIHSDKYLPEHIHTGQSRARAVHSTWFEALTELGYVGFIVLICLVVSCFRATKRCKQVLRESGDIDEYFKVIAIEAALITFLITVTFINRLRAEIFYWLILYVCAAYNIYVLQKEAKKTASTKELLVTS